MLWELVNWFECANLPHPSWGWTAADELLGQPARSCETSISPQVFNALLYMLASGLRKPLSVYPIILLLLKGRREKENRWFWLWAELCPPQNPHIEALTPSTSEYTCIWRQGL